MSEVSKPLQVYIIEDSPIIQRLLGSAIAASGAELSGSSADAQTAIADVFSQEPDVILIDIHLASGSGFDVLKTLKQHNFAPGAVKVVLTNYADEEYRKRSVQLGADRFFDKSSDTSEALALISSLAAQKRSGNGRSAKRR